MPLSKRSSPIFSRKISFYPMPDAAFLKISGAKLELSSAYGVILYNNWGFRQVYFIAKMYPPGMSFKF